MNSGKNRFRKMQLVRIRRETLMHGICFFFTSVVSDLFHGA